MRTQIVGVAVAMLFLAGAHGAVAAKRCRHLCREQVQACVAAARARIVCTDLRGHDRRDCRRSLNTEVRRCKSMRGPILSVCKTSTSVDTCSPSGAFLDASDERR